MGAATLIIYCNRPGSNFFSVLALPFGFLACLVFSVVMHELGHFFAAKMLGLNPYEVTIGHGPIVAAFHLRGINWILRALPSSGSIQVFPMQAQSLRLKWFLMTAAGPAATAALFGTPFVLFQDEIPWWSHVVWRDGLELVLTLLLITNFGLLLSSLVPHYVNYGGFKTPNDGLQLAYLLFKQRFAPFGSQASERPVTARAGNHAQPAPRQGENDQTLQHSVSWQRTIDRGRPDLLLVSYRRWLNHPKLAVEMRHNLLDGFATCVLMSGASEYLDEADRYSKELYEAKPADWTVKGTRGSVLVEKGAVDEGMRLLLEVFENDPSAFDRAISACFLALGEFKLGQPEKAAEWIDRARRIDPNCVPVKRVAALLAKPTADSE